MSSTIRKLAILGGSSPFTLAFFESAAQWTEMLAPLDIVLHGRDVEALGLVARYGAGRLRGAGWWVRWTTSRAEALDRASLVLHQVRYGGLDGREADERFAAEFDVPADETLGPCGLRAALRMAPFLLELARDIRDCCPEAWVVNLTNPLGPATAILTRQGVCRCIGACELPWTTLRDACNLLNVPAASVSWDYAGLNHRGFIHVLEHDGTDLLGRLPQALGTRTIGGIAAPLVAALGALPTKYFRLFQDRSCRPQPRARFLAKLRESIMSELRREPASVPPSLHLRDTSWYPEAVLPLLFALTQSEPSLQVVNMRSPGAWMDEAIVAELRAAVSSAGIEPLPSRAPGGAVARWLERFAEHERCILAAALDPDPRKIRAALEADPLVPPASVGAMAARLAREAAHPSDVATRVS